MHRNIANIVHTSDMNILAVLEYAIEVLGVRHIIVSGHYGCGGVLRAMAEERGALVDHAAAALKFFRSIAPPSPPWVMRPSRPTPL